MNPQFAAEKAISAIGLGYDLSNDVRLAYCKADPSGSRLIELEEALTQQLVLPGGIVVSNVSKFIKSDKGERMRFSSDILSFQQMSEQFNRELSLSGKIPSGLFNAMFRFQGCWQKDASVTKALTFDGWFITLYSIELARSQIVLHDHIKNEVPSSWDPAALARFIEMYGTHIIVGVKMGGKDVIHIKQQHNSVLQQTEVQKYLKKLADERFSDIDANFILHSDESSKKGKRPDHIGIVVSHSKKDDIVTIGVRRGGIDSGQPHNQWLSTVSQAPDVISMSFVPITSLLNGVPGSGFLSHAVNLYLRLESDTSKPYRIQNMCQFRCNIDKPAIEELHQFLEFQLPRQWAPVFGDLPVGPHRKRRSFPSLQFTLLGPKLYVNTVPVDAGYRPVTGVRLYLEGKRSDHLAIHLQHLSSLPKVLQLIGDDHICESDEPSHERGYYEPVKWSFFSHVCTAPVQYSGTRIDDSASIVTRAWFEVREMGMRKILFLRLGFSMVAAAKIRRSEWDGASIPAQKSGVISSLISTRFSTGQIPLQKPAKVDLNSAVFPHGPPVPASAPRMLKFVDTTEMTRGPEDQPGYWVVSGAKLCVEGGKISLRVKYSLLTIMSEEDLSSI